MLFFPAVVGVRPRPVRKRPGITAAESPISFRARWRHLSLPRGGSFTPDRQTIRFSLTGMQAQISTHTCMKTSNTAEEYSTRLHRAEDADRRKGYEFSFCRLMPFCSLSGHGSGKSWGGVGATEGAETEEPGVD